MDLSDGRLIGGRVIHAQPTTGFRTGIEPVLLAAAVPIREGQRVLEAGTGSGAALLCLHARVAGVRSLGVERDPVMAELAAENAAANGFAGMTVVTDDIEAVPLDRDFDHAIANPPYHDAAGSASPVAARETAKRGSPALVRAWVVRLAGVLRDRGSLTLILPAGLLPQALAAMADSRCPCAMIHPLWPKNGRDAKLLLMRGIRNGRAPVRLTAGLVLHKPDGNFTEAAQAILRDGMPLPLM